MAIVPSWLLTWLTLINTFLFTEKKLSIGGIVFYFFSQFHISVLSSREEGLRECHWTDSSHQWIASSHPLNCTHYIVFLYKFYNQENLTKLPTNKQTNPPNSVLYIGCLQLWPMDSEDTLGLWIPTFTSDVLLEADCEMEISMKEADWGMFYEQDPWGMWGAGLVQMGSCTTMQWLQRLPLVQWSTLQLGWMWAASGIGPDLVEVALFSQ